LYALGEKPSDCQNITLQRVTAEKDFASPKIMLKSALYFVKKCKKPATFKLAVDAAQIRAK
jgi:hypothetical protein